jgi:hypothetical protein
MHVVGGFKKWEGSPRAVLSVPGLKPGLGPCGTRPEGRNALRFKAFRGSGRGGNEPDMPSVDRKQRRILRLEKLA